MLLHMKLIVGIGNPDEKYLETRHNVGFMFVDFVAKKIEADDFVLDKKLNAMVAKGYLDKKPVILAKPLSYVNESGGVVGKMARFYKVKSADIIVVQDDLDIEFGNCKNSFDKNSGGHKGIDSIINSLRTKKFYRLRIGTAVRALDKAREQSEKKRDAFVMDFVLSKFTPKDRETLKDVFKDCWMRLEQIVKQ